MTRRAWRTSWNGIDCIVAADSRAKAVASTWRSAFDAHYEVEWKDIRARRAPEYDQWAEVAPAGRPIDPKLVPLNVEAPHA